MTRLSYMNCFSVWTGGPHPCGSITLISLLRCSEQFSSHPPPLFLHMLVSFDSDQSFSLHCHCLPCLILIQNNHLVCTTIVCLPCCLLIQNNHFSLHYYCLPSLLFIL